MSSHYSPTVINFKVYISAMAHGVSYESLLEFLLENRALPEFEKVIDKYNLGEPIHEYYKYRKSNKDYFGQSRLSKEYLSR